MPLPLAYTPPIAACRPTWRELFAAGRFFQRELVGHGDLRSMARDRDWRFKGWNQRDWRRWDSTGALRPIGFALAPYFSGMSAPAVPPDELVFTDERAYGSWDEFTIQIHDHDYIVDRYSPWQSLMFSEVFDAETRQGWHRLHEAWEPTLKVLVRLQGRYWPDVYGRVRLLSAVDEAPHDPVEREGFDPDAVLVELGLDLGDVQEAYEFFAHHAHLLEPRDGLFLLRQMLPRGHRQKFKGLARRAQDFYDAADVFRRFYYDLTGDVLAEADIIDEVAGQEQLIGDYLRRREDFFGHPARLHYDAEDARRLLQAIGLYPFGVHVVVEGETERLLVEHLIRATVGDSLGREVSITDLGGVGGIMKAQQLMAALNDYVGSSVLIIDNEGDAQRVAERLITDGRIDAADVLVMQTNLEEANLTPAEMVDVAVRAAATPNAKRAGTELRLSVDDLVAAHQRQLDSAAPGQRRGMASTLERLTRNPNHGPAPVSKTELARGFAEVLLDDFDQAHRDEAGREAVFARRQVLRHVFDRIVDPLLAAPLDRPRRRRTH